MTQPDEQTPFAMEKLSVLETARGILTDVQENASWLRKQQTETVGAVVGGASGVAIGAAIGFLVAGPIGSGIGGVLCMLIGGAGSILWLRRKILSHERYAEGYRRFAAIQHEVGRAESEQRYLDYVRSYQLHLQREADLLSMRRKHTEHSATELQVRLEQIANEVDYLERQIAQSEPDVEAKEVASALKTKLLTLRSQLILNFSQDRKSDELPEVPRPKLRPDILELWAESQQNSPSVDAILPQIAYEPNRPQLPEQTEPGESTDGTG